MVDYQSVNNAAPISLPPDPVIEAYKPGVDVTLLIENLKLTYQQRLEQLMAWQRFVRELQRAGREARN